MLAIGRALMCRPKVVLLDEPSLGLAPMLVEEIFGIVSRLVKQEKLSVLLVEQNATMALAVADHGYVMENGRIVLEGQRRQAARQLRHQGVLSGAQRGRRAQKSITTPSITSGANAGYPRSDRPVSQRSCTERSEGSSLRIAARREDSLGTLGTTGDGVRPMSEIDRLRDMIDGAKRIVAFTGAGISTEFGHPRLPLAGRHLDQVPADLLRRLHGVGGDAARILAAQVRDRRDHAQGRAQCRPPRARQAGRAGQDDGDHHPERRRPAPALGRAGLQDHRAARQYDLRELPRLRPALRARADQARPSWARARCRSARSARAS